MNNETLDKAVWHILAEQMTHAINCEDPKHRKAMSCVAFTAGAHVELMQLIKEDRERAVREARIDELNRLIKLHTRTYTQTITDNMGEVYLSDGHSYISKYEAQERLAQLSNPAQEKGKL